MVVNYNLSFLIGCQHAVWYYHEISGENQSKYFSSLAFSVFFGKFFFSLFFSFILDEIVFYYIDGYTTIKKRRNIDKKKTKDKDIQKARVEKGWEQKKK